MKKKNVIINKSELLVFGLTVILNMKVTAIEIKYYQFKNILIKLDHN